MSDAPHAPDPIASALFVTDRELHRRINPSMGWDRFRAVLRHAELLGFHKAKDLWGGRYWPEVKAWLDNDNKVHDHGRHAEDGPEHFDAPARKATGLQDRPHAAGRHPAAVLDRPPGRARPDGVSRRLHPIAR